MYKKYNDIGAGQVVLGSSNNDYNIYKYDYSEDKNLIYVKAKRKTVTCPCCGETTDKLHSTYERTIQTLPINMKPTYLKVKNYKYDCVNEECDCKVIMGPLDFVSPNQVKTDDLICTMIALSAYFSAEGASKIFKKMGIIASNDTIGRLYDKLIIEDNPDVEGIGVDDVAIKKGRVYVTAIYDLNDHHLIALLEGRDGKSFKEWLKNHPKVGKVARDRASAYAKAINEILSKCIQIADRFHLLQNLIDYLEEIVKEELPNEIIIQDGKIVENPAKTRKPCELTEEEKNWDYDTSAPLDENGNEIEFDKAMAFKNERRYIESKGRKLKKKRK